MAIKVLIVEDDQFLLHAYQVKLTKVGFDIRTAGDGVIAMETLQTFKPDVILLDLIMPRKDGFATLTEIKADPKLKDIPVVITSNLGQEAEAERVIKLGATEFITKNDISLDNLIKKIESVAKSK